MIRRARLTICCFGCGLLLPGVALATYRRVMFSPGGERKR